MAVRSLNKVMLIGNLTRDPNLRYTPNNTAVCSFGLATNRAWNTDDGREERTDFHNVVSWAKLAEICDQILQKGDKVYVEGRLQTRDWKVDDGPDRRVTEIVIDNMIKLASPRGRSGDNSGDSSDYKKKESTEEPAKESEVDTEEVADDIPF
ncbi:MAG: single-stranded DNA-binding protein [Patescibacteria group bacterium]|nr:single-stranded DNA-binding protein [Patescibacteria group bacterium]